MGVYEWKRGSRELGASIKIGYTDCVNENKR
ncbi:hypothetical protein ACVLD2_003788 [Paenibacillus sp. PvR052]|nr:hypothetical protein [Paenibacillus sp. PvP091]MBP1171643.1 hypothetical protein [Paenibacillus sp. PvR098]MBP2438024.1 hypothetical protein [Paenibacillus sp. PvP052]